MRTQLPFAIFFFFGLIAWPLNAAEDLAAIDAAMKKSWEKYNAISYDSETVSEVVTEHFSNKTKLVSSTSLKKSGEQWLMRTHSNSNSSQQIAGQPATQQISESWVINDGKYVYSLTDTGGMKQATKSKNTQFDVAGTSFLQNMQNYYDFKVLPDEARDGRNCWVIEGKMKQQVPGQGATRYYIAKDHGQMIYTETKNEAGAVISSTTIQNIQLDPSFPADHFVFTPPAGVTVIDLDQLQEASQQAATATPAATEEKTTDSEKQVSKSEPEKKSEPKSEPKKEEKKERKIKVPGF